MHCVFFSQIATPVDVSIAPREVSNKTSNLVGFLEVIDLHNHTLKYIPIPE